MKDYTQENYDRLCAALTMDELANFMDELPRKKTAGRLIGDRTIASYKLWPAKVLDFSLYWKDSLMGQQYWVEVHNRLCSNEA